ALSEEQLSKISAAMEKRLSRKVKLNCKIDKSVMAGVIIRAGDVQRAGYGVRSLFRH
ncbi:F0F1 ATP synthase subunit delta, partial [Salmonella enterica subsp. enterica serovar Kentucky]|nr:F0F1 ATP synthase subunit delta [Salmonella enterica subsp. enterica serovar Kentucky]